MLIFTKSFWVTTLEVVVVAFASTFAGSLVITTTPSVHGLLAAAVAGGVAGLYAFTKQFGGAAATKSATNKVSIIPPPK